MKFLILMTTLALLFCKNAIAATSKNARNAVISTVEIENIGLIATTTIITEVYSRLGYSLKLVRLPAQRALPEANSGKYDGELYRVAAVEKEFTNLRRVATPIGELDFVAYGKKGKSIKITDWDSLKSYRLGAQLGIKYVELKTQGMKIQFVTDAEQLVRLLHRDRIDLIVVDRNTMLAAIKKISGTKDSFLLEIIQEIKVLENQPIYHFVYKTNESEIPKIDSMIQTLKKEGFIKKAWDSASK